MIAMLDFYFLVVFPISIIEDQRVSLLNFLSAQIGTHTYNYNIHTSW